MGKKRVIEKTGETEDVKKDSGGESSPISSVKTVKVAKGMVHIQATYNNTIITITDDKGNTISWSSAGSLGFSGAKKATPFVAARVAETAIFKARKSGIQDVAVFVSGVGSGRDSAIRAVANQGLNIISIKDITPIPHNGPRPKKVRRV